MKRTLILLAVLALPVATLGQTWVARYNGSSDYTDEAYAITWDPFRNIYVAGYTYEHTWRERCFTVVRYDSSGSECWVWTFEGEGMNPVAWACAITKCLSFHHIYATGYAKGDTTSLDFFTVKFHRDGDTVWTRRYNGPSDGSDAGKAIAVDFGGYIYVTGESNDSLGDGIAIVKYSPDGTQLWVRRCDGRAPDLALDVSGNAYVTGSILSGAPVSYDILAIRYSPSGDTLWARTYDSPDHDHDFAEGLVVDADRNVYVAGTSRELPDSIADFLVIKYDSLGNLEWASQYDSPLHGDDWVEDAALCRSGGVYVTGYSNGFGTGNDILTIRYTADGDTAWVRRYNGPSSSNDAASCVAVNTPPLSECVYVGGHSLSPGTSYDYILIQYSSDGTEDWVATYDGPSSGWDEILALTVDPDRNIVVTGWSRGVGTGADYCTVKYPPTGTGVEETRRHESPPGDLLIEASPNPFARSTSIGLANLPALSKTDRVDIYDITGKRTRSLQPAPVVAWDGTDSSGRRVPAGIYFVLVETPHSKRSKKIVMLR